MDDRNMTAMTHIDEEAIAPGEYGERVNMGGRKKKLKTYRNSNIIRFHKKDVYKLVFLKLFISYSLIVLRKQVSKILWSR